MKLRVFQSDKGDCLLLTSSDGKRVLIDGGMAASYDEHVAPALHTLQQNGQTLDVVYVSHIDQDHIAGVLKMTDDLVAWKIFDFQRASGNTHIREPEVPRPPAIGKVWNNAFHEQVGDNADDIERLLAARARALTLIREDFALEAAEEHAQIAQSKAEAIRLSRRLGSRQLAIPVNPDFDRKLMFVTDPPDPLSVGTLQFTVIGPFKEDLENLRDEWNDWLQTQAAQNQLEDIRRHNDRDEDRLVSTGLSEALRHLLAQAAVLGDRSEVTLPNLASLMFFIQESDGKTLLATGDGHWEDVLSGLESTGVIAAGAGLHVNVLKMLHHGSEHNWHHDFGRRITADHYVFCGNGAHHNPDLNVIDAVLDSRFGPPAKRSANPETGRRFKLWFNSASSIAKPANKSHMKKIEAKVAAAKAVHPGKLSSYFLKRSYFDVGL